MEHREKKKNGGGGEYSRHVGQNQNLNLCNWSPRKRGNENEKEATLQLKGRDHQTGQKSSTQPHLPAADNAEAEVKAGKAHARTQMVASRRLKSSANEHGNTRVKTTGLALHTNRGTKSNKKMEKS